LDWTSFFDNVPEILTEAAKSELGVAALVVVGACVVAVLASRTVAQEYRGWVVILTLGGLFLLGFQALRTADLVVEHEHPTRNGEAPTLLAPAEGAVVPQPYQQANVFLWSEPAGRRRVLEYQLHVLGPNSTLPAINVRVPGLRYRDRRERCTYVADVNRAGWTWKVRAHFTDGAKSPWSDERSFSYAAMDSGKYCRECPDSGSVRCL